MKGVLIHIDKGFSGEEMFQLRSDVERPPTKQD